MKRIYLYGIAGVADHYKVVRYSCVDSEGMTIMALKYEAARLRMDYPNIGHVYAVDASQSLYRSSLIDCENRIPFESLADELELIS